MRQYAKRVGYARVDAVYATNAWLYALLEDGECNGRAKIRSRGYLHPRVGRSRKGRTKRGHVRREGDSKGRTGRKIGRRWVGIGFGG